MIRLVQAARRSRPQQILKACSLHGRPWACVAHRHSVRFFSVHDQAVEEMYQRKTPVEHVLLRPGMYIGSTAEAEYQGISMDSKLRRFRLTHGTHIPGIVKLFDEILVNAMDNRERDIGTKNIYIELPIPEDSIVTPVITVRNDGKGIPVVQHSKEDMLVPELIMGHLLTGSNFDDSASTAAGGRHGFGAKLTNIFSQEFTIETADSSAGKHFRKTWRSNMQESDPACVTEFPRSKGGDFTSVQFKPDLSHFGRKDGIVHAGTVHALYERAFQAAAVMGPLGVTVHVNGSPLPVHSIADYAALCNGPDGSSTGLVELPFSKTQGGHWQAVLGVSSHHNQLSNSEGIVPLPTSEGHVECCSFVNGMRTYRGGSHVQAIVEPVAACAARMLNKKHKGSGVTTAIVKSHLRAFVSARLPECAFDSQAKERLVSDIAPDLLPPVPDAAVRRLLDSGLEAAVMNTVTARSNANSARAVRKAVKDASIAKIPKLEDANWAGGRRSNQCTLILTEGDSAKALAMAGLSVVGRNQFGVFPLKGKVLNVRDLTPKAAVANTEVAALISILGLDFNKTYEECAPGELPLRYGHVMIMADQDTDGSHIKGLLVNVFHTFWPHLLHACDGSDSSFLQQFVTPVVKAKRGKQELQFFSIGAFNDWAATQSSLAGWKTKYYKGLGTSTSAEGRAYFSDLAKHRRNFKWGGQVDSDKLQMAFSKQHVAARKQWLQNSHVAVTDTADVHDTFESFVDQELVHFSKADIMRSIPGIIDGLKPSQRKVLYSCMQRPSGEVKVAQLAGFVSEFTAYHHGEASLLGTIVNMSQDFVGSNNVNLLDGVGQFGTRLAGGKDAASARYIFTSLAPVARKLFPSADDALLPRIQEDGRAVEPHTFVPIAPLLLMNGAEGIGTGWSTSVLPHSPAAVVETTAELVGGLHDSDDLRDLLATKAGQGYSQLSRELYPWARGFTGSFDLQPNGSSFVTRGAVQVDDTLRSHRGQLLQKAVISELPLRKWTEDYRSMLRRLAAENKVVNIKEYHTESTVHFELDLVPVDDEPFTVSEAVQLLKLQGTLSASNMHAVDVHGSVVRLDGPMDAFIHTLRVRHEAYQARMQFQAAQLIAACARYSNQVRFIKGVISGRYPLGSRSLDEVAATLETDRFASSISMLETEHEQKRMSLLRVSTALGLVCSVDQLAGVESGRSGVPAFKYLLDMPISSMTRDRVQQLESKLQQSQKELVGLGSVSASQVWLGELDALAQSIQAVDKTS